MSEMINFLGDILVPAVNFIFLAAVYAEHPSEMALAALVVASCLIGDSIVQSLARQREEACYRDRIEQLWRELEEMERRL